MKGLREGYKKRLLGGKMEERGQSRKGQPWPGAIMTEGGKERIVRRKRKKEDGCAADRIRSGAIKPAAKD